MVQVLAVINSLLKGSGSGSANSSSSISVLKSKQIENAQLKSKLILLIGIIFIISNFLLSSLVFKMGNFHDFIEISSNVNNFIHLQKNFFKNNKFFYKDTSLFVNGNRGKLDQNLTTSVYFDYIRNVYKNEKEPELYLKTHPIDFDWCDWVDCSVADPFFVNYNDFVKKLFKGNKKEMDDLIKNTCMRKVYDERDPWVDKQEYDEQLKVTEHLKSIEICGAIYKHYFVPNPQHILFETDFNYFELGVKKRKLLNRQGQDKIVKDYYKDGDLKEVKDPNFQSHVIKDLRKIFKDKDYKMNDYSLPKTKTQDVSVFDRPNIDDRIRQFESKESPTLKEIEYLDFLKFSKENVAKAHKFFFTFPNIRADTKAEMHHYNFPWLQEIIQHQERTKVIHHLIRTWFKFCEHAGVVSWFNYGNLIGWYFNGLNLPWDNDVDVQVSIDDLDKLGKYYNNTLIVENREIGNAIFWFYTDPFYLQQKDNQFIDARLIDANAGIYIDVSALWKDESKDMKPKDGEITFRCKHYNWFYFSDIFPLRRTLFEGAQGYMPNNFEVILNRFYNRVFEKLNVFNYNYQEDLGMWVSNQICENDKIPKERFDKNEQLTLFGACNNTKLLNDYNELRPYYESHKRSLKILKEHGNTDEYFQFSEQDFPILRHFEASDYF